MTCRGRKAFIVQLSETTVCRWYCVLVTLPLNSKYWTLAVWHCLSLGFYCYEETPWPGNCYLKTTTTLNWGGCLQFRGSVHYHHGREHGSMALVTSWSEGNMKWTKTLGGILSFYETSKPVSTVTHFHQDHTYSKAILPSSALPLGAIFSQTTTDSINCK